MDKLFIAQVAHEVNRAYCLSIGDTSQSAWADAEKWQQDSAMMGVDVMLANPEATPEELHLSWLAQKEKDGWVFGPLKDPKKKEHPCMVPYSELPEKQRTKDYLFKGVVAVLAGMPDTQAPTAPAPTSGPVTAIAGQVPVKYIGQRESYKDGAYSTGIVFKKGETRLVPADKAKLMLRHSDVYVLGQFDLSAAAPPAATAADKKAKDTEEEEIEREDALRSIGTMNKLALKNFAKTNFNREMDTEKASAAEMRQQITVMIDQFGLPK